MYLRRITYGILSEKTASFLCLRACSASAPPNGRKTPFERIVDASPLPTQPYLRLVRLDKPIGTWLLLWPGYWSIAMATPAGTIPDLKLLGIFGAGSLLMRGAGCVINDMWDRKIDAKVARTKDRPLASGMVPIEKAIVFLGGILSTSLVLLLQLNWNSIVLGLCSMGPVISYPLFKRITYWPQLVLGITFNWGALLGWCAVHGQLYLPAVLPLYSACIAWTLIYDTIYAHQDRNDDLMVGVKSTALLFGENTKKYLTGFAVMMTSGLLASGLATQQLWPYYVCIALCMSHVANQLPLVSMAVFAPYPSVLIGRHPPSVESSKRLLHRPFFNTEPFLVRHVHCR